MVVCTEETAAYDPQEISRLASADSTYKPREVAITGSYGCGIDDEQMRRCLIDLPIHVRNGDCGFIRSRPTEKPPGTRSDYYEARFPGCPVKVFLKFFVLKGSLVVSSFKEYENE